jgi:hypothetical protein
LVLELGIGVGLFARFFLNAFRQLCQQQGKDYYERLTYVAADSSERMLLDAARHGTFAEHPGRYLLRIADALAPEQALLQDPIVRQRGPRPFRAVFLNYLLDCLPAAVLRFQGDRVEQLCARTCLARSANPQDLAPFRLDELARLADSPDPRDRRWCCTRRRGRASTWGSIRSPTCVRPCRGCSRWGRSRRPSGCWSGCRIGGCWVVPGTHRLSRQLAGKAAGPNSAAPSACGASVLRGLTPFAHRFERIGRGELRSVLFRQGS